MKKNKTTSTPTISIKKTGPKVSAVTISVRYRAILRKNKSAYEKINAYLQSLRWKNRVIERPQNAKERVLKEKYLKEVEYETSAFQLLDKYSVVGMTRAEAMQAVKTNKVSELINKWDSRLTKWKKVQEALTRGRLGELLKHEG